jgi:hypothetical protein
MEKISRVHLKHVITAPSRIKGQLCHPHRIPSAPRERDKRIKGRKIRTWFNKATYCLYVSPLHYLSKILRFPTNPSRRILRPFHIRSVPSIHDLVYPALEQQGEKVQSHSHYLVTGKRHLKSIDSRLYHLPGASLGKECPILSTLKCW